ncbi:MAG: hypothetical protein HZA08_10895 [Nitrospirae bacterium]|nr:hypothetical protein [Nitrospirota bacterium]
MSYGDFSGAYMKKKLLILLSLFLMFCSISVYAADPPDSQSDVELKNIWNSMVTSLIKKDIESALDNFTLISRWKYHEQFKQVSDKLPEIFSGMRDIEKIYIKKGEAKYRVRFKENGREYTSFIWFTKDMLGRWKIDKF